MGKISVNAEDPTANAPEVIDNGPYAAVTWLWHCWVAGHACTGAAAFAITVR